MMLSRQSSRHVSLTLFNKYKENKDLCEAVRAWQEQETDVIMVNGMKAPGTMGGDNLGKPLFQFLPMNKTIGEGGTMIYETSNCISFIPAGFRDAPTQNKMNPVREEIGGSSALQSLVHILTIPKNTRIYNSASVSAENLPLLEEMKECGKKAVEILANGPKEMIGSLRWVLSQEGSITMTDERTLPLRVTVEDMSEEYEETVMDVDVVMKKNKNIDHTFHVYPAASIGWLHLHSFLGDLKTKAYDTMEEKASNEGYVKNTNYEDVVKAVYLV